MSESIRQYPKPDNKEVLDDSNSVTLSVNGKDFRAKKGTLLIDTLLQNAIHIPHFCYHPALGKDGNCRMCMVEIEGQKRPQISCDTPIKEGMVVRTLGENIEKVRRDILELELINHPIDCPTCDQAGECSLQEFYMTTGLYHSRMSVPKNNKRKRVDLGSNVMLDEERCVLCTRCVRFTKDVTKTNELGVIDRGDYSTIGTFPGTKLDNPYAMNVIDLCPVGALTSKDFRFHQRVWFLKTFDGICSGCSRGCSVFVDHNREKYKDDKIYRLRPRYNPDINGHFICDKGRLSYKKENENRVTNPLYQGEDIDMPAVLEKITTIINENMPVLMVLSPNLSIEDMAKIKDFAKMYHFSLSGYAPQYFDDEFADGLLKTYDKSVNRKGFDKLNINQDEAYFNTALQEAKTVIIIDNNYFDDHLEVLGDKKSIGYFSNHYESTAKMDVIIPIRSFFETSGTFINTNGIEQKVVSTIQKVSLIDHLSDHIAQLENLLQSCEQVVQ